MADDTSYLQELYSGASSAVSSITGSTSETTTSTSSGDGGGTAGWSAIAPAWVKDLSGVADVLEAFGKSPAGFILGAVLSELLGGIVTVVTALLDAMLFVFVGSDPASTDGTLGLADIPVYAAEVLIGATTGLGESSLGLIGTLVASISDVAANAGPAAPLVVAGSISVVAIAGAWTLRTLGEVSLDIVPGLGGLLK